MKRNVLGIFLNLTFCISLLIYCAPACAQEGPFAVDTTDPVTQASINEATLIYKSAPTFWGRYFNGVGYRSAGYEYELSENAPLAANKIPILPVARSGPNVSKNDRVLGEQDAKSQAEDILEDFGEDYLASKGGTFYVFLDVESDTPLSSEYYLGWSTTLENYSSKVRLLPAVYMSATENQTSQSITDAISQGAHCYGLWVAGYPYYNESCVSLPYSQPVWDQGLDATPTTLPSCWSESDISLEDGKCPALVWQYGGNITCGDFEYDLDMVSPNIDAQTFFSRLIPAP